MSMVIQSFDHLHDNRVLCYCADFEAHILHVDTRTEAGENVSVHFTGLLAHWFENVIQDNILFGMDEITVDGYLSSTPPLDCADLYWHRRWSCNVHNCLSSGSRRP